MEKTNKIQLSTALKLGGAFMGTCIGSGFATGSECLSFFITYGIKGAIGALIMSVVTYFISMIPGMSVWQKALQGGIIIVAVAINYFTEQSAKRQALKERSALI